MANERHNWNGRAIIHPQHSAELEQNAAVNEFQHGMPRMEAEHKAYQEYRKTQHLEAAAFHLRGLKSAQGSGDLEEAKKHGAMYQLHAEKLGFEPWKEAPPELKVHLENAAKEKVHKFKAHRGDQFVLDDHKVQGTEPIAKSLHKIYVKAQGALSVLSKASKLPEKDPYVWPKDRPATDPRADNHGAITGGPGGEAPVAHTPPAAPAVNHAVANAALVSGWSDGLKASVAAPYGFQRGPTADISRREGQSRSAGFKMQPAQPQPKAGPGFKIGKHPLPSQPKQDPFGGLGKAQSVSLQEALTKGWPKDDQENQQNTAAHHLFPEAAMDAGAKFAHAKVPKAMNSLTHPKMPEFMNTRYAAKGHVSGKIGEGPGQFNYDQGGLDHAFEPYDDGDIVDHNTCGKCQQLARQDPNFVMQENTGPEAHYLKPGANPQGLQTHGWQTPMTVEDNSFNHNSNTGQEHRNVLGDPDDGPDEPYEDDHMGDHADGSGGFVAVPDSLAADHDFWASIGRATGLNKSWPKDEAENTANTHANAIAQDHFMDRGAVRTKPNSRQLNQKRVEINNDTAAAFRTSTADRTNQAHKGISTGNRVVYEPADLTSSFREGEGGTIGFRDRLDMEGPHPALAQDHEFWHSLGRSVGINANKTCAGCGVQHESVGRVVDPGVRLVDGINKPIDLCPVCYDNSEDDAWGENYGFEAERENQDLHPDENLPDSHDQDMENWNPDE